MRGPNDKEKAEIMKIRLEMMRDMISDGRVSKEWAIKNILGIDKKSEYRKHKIDNIFK